MNSVHIRGEVAWEPVVKTSKAGSPYMKFKVAVVGDKGGRKSYIPCVAFGKLAETPIAKGSLVDIEGSLSGGSYENNGNRVYTLDVACSALEVSGTVVNAPEFGGSDVADDDIPF